MQTKSLVTVNFTGHALEWATNYAALENLNVSDLAIHSFQAFPTPEGGFKSLQKIETDKWHMSQRLSHRLEDEKKGSSFRANAALTILDKMGLTVDYDYEFVELFDRHAWHYMKGAFLSRQDDAFSLRVLGGIGYDRRTFLDLFDMFLTKYCF